MRAECEALTRRAQERVKVDSVAEARLSEHTTVGIGGRAERIVFPRNAAEVGAVVAEEASFGRKVRRLGAGSNLLVSDEGVRGTVLSLRRHMGRIVFLSGGRAVAEGGAMLPRLAVLTALAGLSGVEEVAGIPGTVGGALTMNAGAHGRSICELLEWVEVVDDEGTLHRVDASEARFGYREARYPVTGTIVRASFRFAAGSPEEAFKRMREMNERRRASQPWGERTFGSTFRNPREGEAAGALLEKAGMKGVSVGDAAFSTKHANFLVNTGSATAADAMALIWRGRSAVKEIFGVSLRLEVELWGVDG